MWNAATELQPLAGSTDKNGTQVCSAPGDETYLGYEQSESEMVHHSPPPRFLQDGSSLLFPLFLSEVEAVTATTRCEGSYNLQVCKYFDLH